MRKTPVLPGYSPSPREALFVHKLIGNKLSDLFQSKAFADRNCKVQQIKGHALCLKGMETLW